MQFRTSSLAILLSCCFLTTDAQRQFFKIYTIQDGLIDNNIRNIYQDKNGFIWIGTWEGVSRYDGHMFTNFSTNNGLSHDMVNDFIEENNRLYIALNDGSVDFIQDNRLRKVGRFKTPLNKFLRLSDGKIILSSDENGFYELINERISKPIQENPMHNSQLLLALNDSLLLSVGNNFTLSVFTNNFRQLATAFDKIGINHIYKDASNRIWLCTNKGLRFFSFNPVNKQIKIELPSPELIPSSLVNTPATAIYETEDGLLWIGCTTGLARLQSSTNFKIFTEKDGLPSSAITTIFSDKEKNLWIGTSNGLVKLVRLKEIDYITNFSSSNAGNMISFSVLNNGKIMMSTFDGPKIYDPASDTKNEIKLPLTSSPLIYHEGTYPWVFIGNDGYFQYDSALKNISPLKTGKFSISSFGITDVQGNGFAGLEVNIGIVSQGKFRTKTPPVADRVTAMTIDKQGYLWVGTWKTGLYRVQYSISKDSINFLIKNFTHLVPDKAIRSLYTGKDGSIWVGSRNKGAFRLNYRTGDNYTTETIDKKSGLSSNFITAFADSENNDIWIGSLYGLDKLVKTSSGFSVFNFSRINNLQGLVTQIKAAGNNSWWCIIEQNLVRITDHFLENKDIIRPVITRIRLGLPAKPIEITQSETGISLNYSQNQAYFEFTAPSFINESQILYSIRLLNGNDSSWSEPRNIHEMFYASLKPGSYIFQVRTLGWNKQYSEPVSYKFQVLPPYWQTSWFIMICILFIILFLYLLYRYRLKQIMKIQTVRNRIATDLHDDIGSTLTNISILAELSHKNLNNPPQAASYLDRIAEEINDSGQALDDIIWSINSKNDTLDDMMIRMRRYAAELFDHTDTRYQLILQPSAAAVKIGMEQRRDLYLIYKESLNNIYKHASALNTEIDLKSSGSKITLIIKDDGIGFDIGQETYRNGLKNIKTRVEKWNGLISIESGKRKGTTIHIEMYLQ